MAETYSLEITTDLRKKKTDKNGSKNMSMNIKSKMNTSLGPSYRGRPQRVGERRMGYIGMGRLNDWVRLRDRPEDLMPWMLSNVPELTDFLNSGSIDSRSMELFMICLQAVLQVSSFDQSFNKLLKTLAATDFYGVHLMKYFNQRNDSNMKENAETCLRYIIETSCRIPSSVSECLDILKYIVSNYSHLQCDINLLKEAIKKLRGANKTRAKKDQHLSRRWRDDDEPPENIRDISIFPTRQDLDKDFHPFLRENKTSGAYHHVGHYFDVIFRLMREDFIQPLRVGISKYRQQGAASAEMDMMFYENVKILGVNVFNGIEHILLLDREKLQTVRWDSERRLIFGSLICLSNDNFKTIIYATVSGMDRDELKKGMVRVVFQNCLEDVYGFSSEDSLTMTENPSFFEAYRHVLEGLQEMLGVTLPMEKYIVNCEKDIASPGYLNLLTKYNVSCLLKGNHLSAYVKALSPSTWPNLTQVCLNERQYLAVKTALTHELTLLQGPPGTGKTYVGLKIMKCLLENAASRHEENEPILVVCYTNHALDQFLEEMLPFCPDGIVRVGGKNDSEKLENFNMKELRRNHSRSLSTRNCIRDLHRRMDEIGKFIKELASKMQLLHLSISSEKTLQHFMLPKHFQEFSQFSGRSMRAWLNSSDVDLEKHVEIVVEEFLVKLFISEKTVLLDTNLDFVNPIKAEQKMKVYSYWRQLYEQSGCTNSTHQNTLISESELKDFINPRVFQNIRRHGNLKAWLLGSNICEMLNTIEEIQNKRQQGQFRVFDDKDEYARVREQRQFEDDSDSEEEMSQATKGPAARAQMSVLQKCTLLGIDITCDVKSEESSNQGWVTVQKKFTVGQVIKKLNASKPMDESEVNMITSIWNLNLTNRYKLYKFWLMKYLAQLNTKMRGLVEEYNSVHEIKLEQRQMEDVHILKDAKVIGMTTTGAAKHHKVLQNVGPKIVVVEEAAEVLEAHIVTALSRHCQHLILIGDHQQLRPKTEVYELAKNFGLEISLFERLVKNNINCIQLTEQHRMRPEISKYMKHIYPHLKDSQSVFNREHVMGMDKDIFFITHDRSEGVVQHSKSKLNEYEANYLIKLAQYLVIQGYSSSDITVLATYGGQVSLIKECLASLNDQSLDDLRVSTVDNFQGEQNKIILLSLVRSNRQGSVGFLSTDNRICVALSRAQFGMYVIGNVDLLSQHSDLWAKMKATAECDDEIGQQLHLRCKQHHRLTIVKTYSDFDLVKTGGCGQSCRQVLSCGHICPYLCHAINHEELKCEKPCTEKCNFGHTCQSQCSKKPCPPCSVIIAALLPCKHTLKITCHRYKTPLSAECEQECNKFCIQGHKCKGKCSQSCPPCLEKLKCGHTCINTPLFAAKPAKNVQCELKCLKKCFNGHMCPSRCADQCPPSCTTLLPCQHHCKQTFELDSSTHYLTRKTNVCSQDCQKKCPRGHHACKGKCSEECPPCLSPIRYLFPCGHNDILQCHKDPLKYKCEQTCLKKCKNGHPCPSNCSDKCPLTCTFQIPCQHPCGQSFELDRAISNKNVEIRSKIVCLHDCQKKCPRELHPCTGKCSQECPPCVALRRYRFTCGHINVLECHKDPLKHKCEQTCLKKCKHGHPCPSRCTDKCPLTCTFLLPCQHPCGQSFELDIARPNQNVEIRSKTVCSHACQKKCPRGLHPCAGKCSEECPPCVALRRYLFPCGHNDILQCHKDPLKLKCLQKCPKKCKNGHPCPSNCSDKCPLICTFQIPCQHPCGQSFELGSAISNKNVEIRSKIVCSHDCQKKCTRGLHPCTGKCSQECPPCVALRRYRFTCGHINVLECHKDPLKHKCDQVCLKKCNNGHPCPSNCSDKCPLTCTFQLPCQHPCGKSFKLDSAIQNQNLEIRSKIVCSHDCQKKCHMGLHPCTGKCSQECPPCAALRRYRFTCGHINVLECHKDPLKHNCEQMCHKTCKNGHSCPSRCSNICPTSCTLQLSCRHPCGQSFELDSVSNWSAVLINGTVCSHDCQKKCPRGHHPCKGKCSEECPPCPVLISVTCNMSARQQTRGRASMLTFKELILEWNAIRNSEDRVSSMVQHQKELQRFLTAGEISDQCFPSLVRSFISASGASEKQKEFEGVLKCLCESPFLTQHVALYINSIQSTGESEKFQKVISSIADILTIILNHLPQFSFKVTVAAAQLNLVVKRMNNLPDRDRLLNSLASILHENNSQQRSREKAGHRHDSLRQDGDTDEPPDNFLDISVVPTLSDLLDSKPVFLRRAVVQGPYTDVQHYLDVQFRLMKLDFLIPLKNGLIELIGKKDLTTFRGSDIRLYHKVKIVETYFVNGYNHFVRFDIKRCQNIDWKDTNRLMSGSLVCLSKDNFKTIIIATISKRKIKELKAGLIEINVKDGLEILLQCTVTDAFVMVESTTFFDPYFHVLEGLKTMKGKFPFQNVLIHCKSKLKPPAYILTHSKVVKVPLYDLSSLMRE
ncbi:NFX1-type zinc finger-containing protein 1 [Bulinus truncatus]|nr:NFX1-type zinc finger-containing protein 1 [Bulinus truncatus]